MKLYFICQVRCTIVQIYHLWYNFKEEKTLIFFLQLNLIEQRGTVLMLKKKKEKNELYIKQKKKVQAIIRGDMHIYETKVTNDIKQDKGRGKKLWDNINKLRDKTGRDEDIQLIYDINEQPLKISEMDVEIEQNWDSIYKKKHKNDIIDIWNEDSKCIYKESIENENLMKTIATYGNNNFPIVLREHFDSAIHIEEKVIPMEYPEITQA